MIRLVTGGTGFVGRHLLRELAKRDGETFVLVRPGSRERLETLIRVVWRRRPIAPLEGAYHVFPESAPKDGASA